MSYSFSGCLNGHPFANHDVTFDEMNGLMSGQQVEVAPGEYEIFTGSVRDYGSDWIINGVAHMHGRTNANIHVSGILTPNS